MAADVQWLLVLWCDVLHCAGHDPDNLSGGRVWCLDSQIQHKVQLLKDHVMAPGKPPAVVLAHSIGSYMMLQVGQGVFVCSRCVACTPLHKR